MSEHAGPKRPLPQEETVSDPSNMVLPSASSNATGTPSTVPNALPTPQPFPSLSLQFVGPRTVRAWPLPTMKYTELKQCAVPSIVLAA